MGYDQDYFFESDSITHLSHKNGVDRAVVHDRPLSLPITYCRVTLLILDVRRTALEADKFLFSLIARGGARPLPCRSSHVEQAERIVHPSTDKMYATVTCVSRCHFVHVVRTCVLVVFAPTAEEPPRRFRWDRETISSIRATIVDRHIRVRPFVVFAHFENGLATE